MSYSYWRVSPRIWHENWSDDAKLLALYLLTNRHRTIEGMYYLPKAYAAADLGWTTQRLGKPLAELLRNGFIKYDETVSVVLLVKALKYQRPENPNQVKAALSLLESVPETPLFAALLQSAQQYAEPFAERLRERFGERYGKPQAQTQAQAQALLEIGSGDEAVDDDVIEGDEFLFDEFWSAYPRAEGKQAAVKAWERLTAAERELAVKAAQALRLLCDNGEAETEFVPHGSTFLNGKRWQDFERGVPPQFRRSKTSTTKSDAAFDSLRRLSMEETV